jgi:glycolate oxidase FAD binding subunit
VTPNFRPATEWELATYIRWANEKSTPLEVVGTGSKREVGRPIQAAQTIEMTAISGIALYEPNELIMSARTGTPLSVVEAELARHGQMLAFEPIDAGPLFGGLARQGTIGAVFATNLSGCRRIAAGGARDHLIGLRAVNGRGEIFKSGGRVMKNVTGYDVARMLTGSWGTLAVMTEVTFKVQPVPEETATLAVLGLPDEIAVELMCQAMGSPYEVSGAVHLRPGMASRIWHAGLRSAGKAVTAVRIESFAKSAAYRSEKLRAELAPYGTVHVLDTAGSLSFWDEMRQLSVLQGGTEPLWRISTAPKEGPKAVAAIQRYMEVDALYDWSGGLVWLVVPPSADAGATDIRRVVAHHGGHATLIRADAAARETVDSFQPLEPALDRLTRKLKAAFDPAGLLNPRRMYATL